MMRTLLTGVIIAAAGGVVAAPRPAPPTKVDAGDFVYRSVLDGLTADAVPPDLARSLAKRDDFVGKCGLCGMTRKALFAHGELKQIPAAKEGKGLTEDLAKRLKSDDDAVRRIALRELVQRYMDWGHAKLDVTAEQKAAVQQELERMRKEAPGLPAGQKFCPSCDGACRLVPKL
jgi:hypothetical protein